MHRFAFQLATAAALTILCAGMVAMAEPVKAGDLTISAQWARAMLPGQSTGGGYLTIENHGTAPDRLLAVHSSAAGKVEVHEMKMANDVMVMRPVAGGLPIPAGGSVALAPGGLHLMFTAVKAPFVAGTTVPVTLEFERAGKVDIQLPVGAGDGGGAHDSHGG